MSIDTDSQGIGPSTAASSEAKPGVFIRTFGCQMNEYDSDKLFKILENDYRAVESADQAKLILINTCSVREKPEHKLFSLLGELKLLKDQHPETMIGVGGCVAQQEGKNIISRSSAVDFVFGTHNLSLVPSLLERRRAGAPPQVAIDYRDEWEELPDGFAASERVSRFVSISRGCNKNCTYCIVPTTRGAEVSRSAAEVEKEVRIAVHRGAREVVLLGQTVNSYGLDLTPRIRFAELLDRLSQIEALARIRFTSPHPQEVRADFINLVRNNPKVCKHIHMPLQSGSDRILKLMNRNYRVKRYLEIIDELKAACPEIAITTDVIVGFPGETEQDFEETMRVLEYVQYENSYSFMFSPRPGTVAAEMEDSVSPADKLRRLQLFQARQEEITQFRLARYLDQEMEILIDNPSKNDPNCMQGRTTQNVVVNLNFVDGLKPGDLVVARIAKVSRYSLKGEFIRRTAV